MVYIKKKNKTRFIVLLLIVFVFLYWRGVKSMIMDKGLNCKFHLAYAVCSGQTRNADVPGIFEVLKAGAKF